MALIGGCSHSSTDPNACVIGHLALPMSSQSQHRAGTVIRIALMIGGLCGLVGPGDVVAEVDTSLPPSNLWSREFKEFYERSAENAPPRSALPLPERSAPKFEWDKYDESVDANLAKSLDQVLNRYPVQVVDTKIAGVRVGMVLPKDGIMPANQHRVLINLHGGGFVSFRGLGFGQLESVPVASIGRFKIITVDYRQAPFHKYPAASEDIEAIYKELLKRYRAEAIGIFGCSAGGTLTAQAVAWFQANGLPRPGAVGIFCSEPMPNWFQQKGDSGIWLSSSRKSKFSDEEKAAWEPSRWYMEGASSDDPRAYPGSSDVVLAKFPPTLFLTGTRDFEMSAVIVAHARFLKLGVDSALYVMEGAPHAAHVFAVGTPEAHNAYAYIARWFDQHLAR
jgi:epsilon-lactone hydrolase